MKKKTNIKGLILISLLAIMFYSCRSVGTLNKDARQMKIDELMNFYIENELFNGTILVASKGNIIYKKAAGYTNYDRKEQIQLNTIFSLASVSKTFTSTAILILKEQGKLSLNDKLSIYFPDYPNADKITIWNLMTHTSGLPNYLDFGGYFRVDGKPGDFVDGVTNRKAFDYLSKIDTLRFEPGKRFEYSNSGYFMLSMIVEEASGKQFHQFMKDEIFKPLQMSDSYIISDPKLQILNRGHGFSDFYDPDDDNLMTTGGGGVLSTIEDLYKWHLGLSSEKIISSKTLNSAYINPMLNDGSYARQESDSTWCYGMGWIYRINDNDSIAWHDGGLNACSAIFYRDLKRDYTIIILSNKGATNQNHSNYSIRDGIVKIMKGESFSYPLIPISIKLMSLINSIGIESAYSQFQEIKLSNESNLNINVNQLNRLGYYY